ncbi:MAG: hypothetical protein ACERKO_09475 [Acetanaerobacterium sp.]
MRKAEMLRLLSEKIEAARYEYHQILSKPERYRELDELACAEQRLITLECLGMDYGIITTGTI